MTLTRTGFFGICFLLFANLPGMTTADEKPDQEALGQQLDSDEFTERQAASEQLQALGKDAIPVLIKGAQHKSLEPRRRSFAILSEFLKSKDDATKAAAKQALEQLAENENTKVAAAAKKALEPPKPPQPIGRPNVFGGAVQIQIGGGGVRVNVRNANGVKTIEVKDGKNEVKIVAGPDGIQGEMTIKDANGKEKTTKVTAKDEDDLKKKSPEIHKYYKKYANGGAGVQIAINGANIGQRQVRVPAPRLMIPGLVDPKDLDTTGDELTKAIENLKKLAEKSKDADGLMAAIKSLESAKATIEKMKEGSDISNLHKRMREAHQNRIRQIRP